MYTHFSWRCVVEVIKGMRMSAMSRHHVLNKIVYGVLHACTCETFKSECARKTAREREGENARARALTNDFMRDDKWFGEHSEVTVRTKWLRARTRGTRDTRCVKAFWTLRTYKFSHTHRPSISQRDRFGTLACAPAHTMIKCFTLGIAFKTKSFLFPYLFFCIVFFF